MHQDLDAEPALWGRRTYADVEAREILNDESERIARQPPDHVDDPGDPTLTNVLREQIREGTDVDPSLLTLSDLKKHGLSFGETVCWYWYRHAGWGLAKIDRAARGHGIDGDGSPPSRNAIRNMTRQLKSAASKLPGESPDDVPDVADVIDSVGVDPEPAAQG